MSGYQKLAWLVDTKRARDFSDAGRILNQAKAKKHKPMGMALAKTIRLPYKDE